MLPTPESAESHAANQQRLVAIELQRKKGEELERQAQLRKLDNASKQLELQQAVTEKLAAFELHKEKKLAAIKHKEKKLAAIKLQEEKRLAAVELRREKVEELEHQAQQRDLDTATKRLELQRLRY
jgi:hypothetical protein